MTDRFLGSWLVTENVFGPDGTLLGKVRQTRRLEELAGGALRVVQDCQPEPELADHAMAAFAGEWVFEMSVEGSDRYYNGPDVIGRGTQWVEGVMTGQGMWPRFGHTFRSFSVMAGPDRQITGGTFSTGSALDASIAGVAVTDDGAGEFPELPTAVPEFPAIEPGWIARRYGPVQESESWISAEDHRVRLSIYDDLAGAVTSIELRNGGSGRVTVSAVKDSAG